MRDVSERVTLRLMTEEDLPMLHEWLNRPHIVEWWGGERPSLEQVRTEYLPSTLREQRVTPYIGMLGSQPFAYAQSYVALGAGGGWWEDETDPGVRGIDQSIADPALLEQGLGTHLVRSLVDLLFCDPEVTMIQTDPAPENHRAIRCYEKAGFRRVKVIETPDGPALYMVQNRSSAPELPQAGGQVEPVESRSDTRSRFIPASPAQVFAAMRDPRRVARWWGPAGFTSTIHKYEFTPSGSWLLTMHGPDGKDYPNESRFTRIDQDRLFEIEHLSGHHFMLTLELQPHAEGTRVMWRQTFDTTEHYQQLAKFVAEANEQNLERLAAEVAIVHSW